MRLFQLFDIIKMEQLSLNIMTVAERCYKSSLEIILKTVLNNKGYSL